MLKFSEQHAWQGDEAVQQILVFTDEFAERQFKVLMKDMTPVSGDLSDVSDTAIGAAYKLRSVKADVTGTKFEACIRSGFDGRMLWEDIIIYPDPKAALLACLTYLTNVLHNDVARIMMKMHSTKNNVSTPGDNQPSFATPVDVMMADYTERALDVARNMYETDADKLLGGKIIPTM